MWHDHPFSQKNKTTERAAWLGVGGCPPNGQNLKKGGCRHNRKGPYKIGGLGPPCQLCLFFFIYFHYIFMSSVYNR